MENKAAGRIAALQRLMEQNGIDYYIVPTADFHGSEYAGDYFKLRSFLSGFTGSAGTLVVERNAAGLWTDGRYFVQAQAQLEGSGIKLFKMGEENVPDVFEYLQANVSGGQTVGFDGRVMESELGKKLEEHFNLSYDRDLAGELWEDRPSLSATKAWCVPDDMCGMGVDEKLEKVRESMRENGAAHLLISKLDDIMWLYNIRANDVECNPVALSYTFVSMDSAVLFIQEQALTDEVREKLDGSGIEISEYGALPEYLKNCEIKGKIQYSGRDLNYFLYKLIEGRAELIDEENPTELLKAVKTPRELESIRKFYLLDSVVLTKFLFWVKNNAGKVPMDELGLAKRLDSMRGEIEGFLDISFETISAYKANAAMAHYSATKEHSAKIEADGFYLVDSGAQYMGATTDVTRTIALGHITDEMKMHFTKVACSMLRLADAKFLHGCTGRNLDIIAREPLWSCGLDYKHGTGHGIGFILNVHEGPHSLRWQYKQGSREAKLEAGMIVSDEPGIYIENSHSGGNGHCDDHGYGIRTENIVEIVNEQKNEYGQFMGFRHLTYVPIDLDAIDTAYMEESDIEKLNAYHEVVYEKLSPYFDGEELEQLKAATKKICKKN